MRVPYGEGEIFFLSLPRQPFAIQNQGNISEAIACFTALLVSSEMQIE